jgi:hypothetical protein
VVPTYPLYSRPKRSDHGPMYLRAKTRTKDGKTHRYWSVVECRRLHDGRVIQRQVLYLGELNDAQRAGWVHTIQAVENDRSSPRQLALFADDSPSVPDLS